MKKEQFDTIYFPVTADIITAGHIKCFQYLKQRCDFLIVGVLTDSALKGYKKPINSLEDRMEVLNEMYSISEVVEQNSLDPLENIEKYKPDAIASGDGWEDTELNAIRKYNLKVINIELEGEKGQKRYSSSAVKKKIKEQS